LVTKDNKNIVFNCCLQEITRSQIDN
jgi:hypothetical protein